MHSFVFIILFCPEAARVKLKDCSRDFILPLFFLLLFFLRSKQFLDRDAETALAHKTCWNISTQMTISKRHEFKTSTFHSRIRQLFISGDRKQCWTKSFLCKKCQPAWSKTAQKKGAFANAGMKICYTSRQATKECAPAKVLTALFRTEIETMYGNRYQLFNHSCCKCALLQTCTEAMRKSSNSTPNAAGCWKCKRIKSWG